MKGYTINSVKSKVQSHSCAISVVQYTKYALYYLLAPYLVHFITISFDPLTNLTKQRGKRMAMALIICLANKDGRR